MTILIAQNACRKKDDPPDPDIIEDTTCLASGTIETFDIITFNIKEFPLAGYGTIELTAEIILEMDADIIAMQEISSESEFNKLLALLEGWSGIWYPISNGVWNLSYIYKDSEVIVDNLKTKVIFDDDSFAFPRPPLEIHASHIQTGIDAIIINNHLKCCSGADNESRRRSASVKLDEYVEANYSDQAVIIIGDLNDIIQEDNEQDNLFWNFVSDELNYRFTDMHIAKGSQYGWSFPSYPSHIDHILVTNELFNNIDTTLVYRPKLCFSDYTSIVSDHRPVCIRLK